jgi:PIN domain nuclease of toxin-antitoxin system
LLLDTHVLIWMCIKPSMIPTSVELIIKSSANQIFISAATPWEISIKLQKGKLDFDRAFLADFDNRIRGLAFEVLAITSAHGVAAGALKGRHQDPFDRMLVAQAQVEQLAIVSRDPELATLGAQVLW